jgi:hypothetical protein
MTHSTMPLVPVASIDFSDPANFPTSEFCGLPMFVAPDGNGDLSIWRGLPTDPYPRAWFTRTTVSEFETLLPLFGVTP